MASFTNIGVVDRNDKEFGNISKKIFSVFYWFVTEVENDGKWKTDEWAQQQDEAGDNAISGLLTWTYFLRLKPVFHFLQNFFQIISRNNHILNLYTFVLKNWKNCQKENGKSRSGKGFKLDWKIKFQSNSNFVKFAIICGVLLFETRRIGNYPKRIQSENEIIQIGRPTKKIMDFRLPTSIGHRTRQIGKRFLVFAGRFKL